MFIFLLLFVATSIILKSGDKGIKWESNYPILILNILMIILHITIYFMFRTTLTGIKGQSTPKKGMIKLGIETTKDHLKSIKKVPDYEKFLQSCASHRQASGMLSAMMIPVISIKEVGITTNMYLAGASGIFLTQAISAPLWK